MEYKIESKDNLHVVGKSIWTSHKNKDITLGSFWRTVLEDGTMDKLMAVDNSKPVLGVCYDKSDDGFRYLIGIENNSVKDELAELEYIDVPKSTWAVFDAVGPIEKSIPNTWGKIFSEFLQSGEYSHAGTADIELYHYGNVHAKEYKCQVMIPVIK